MNTETIFMLNSSPTQTSSPQRWHSRLIKLAQQRWIIVLRSFVLFLLIWWACAIYNKNPLQLPTPQLVAQALLELWSEGEIWDHAAVSTVRLILALLLAMILALPLGLWMGLSRPAHDIIDPLVELLRPISGIAWLPLALFIFGVGNTLPVFIMVYVAFFPLLLNTISGVHQVDSKLLAAAKTMGIGRVATLRHVVIPSALPHVMVGLRLAFASAWAAIVAAELIGSPSGLGFAIEWYRQLLMTSKVFAFIVVIGTVGYVCDVLLRKAKDWLTPWSQGQELS